jgi:hypothetical protein
MAGNLARQPAPTIHGSVYVRLSSGKRLKRLSHMPDFIMPAPHRIDATRGLNIPLSPDNVWNLLSAQSDVTELMIAQFPQQPLLGMVCPGTPRRPQQCPRKGQQPPAGPAERRLALRLQLETIGPTRNQL